MRVVVTSAALLTLGAVSGLVAQETRTPQPGEQVRVLLTDRAFFAEVPWISGAYRGTRNDSIILRYSNRAWFTYPTDSVRSMEGWRCCKVRPARVLIGGTIGFLAGTALGLGSAWIACDADRYLCDMSDAGFRRDVAVFALTRAGVGALVGGALGAWWRSKAWMPLGIPGSLEVTPVGPLGPGVTAGVTLRVPS